MARQTHQGLADSTRASAAANLRQAVLQLVAALPTKRATTYGAIAEYLDVTPRQVAAVMARLDDAESTHLPWHRVVASGGRLGNFAGAELQVRRLTAEAVQFTPRYRIVNFDNVYIPPSELNSGVPRGQRHCGAAGSPRRRRAPRLRRE